MFEINSQQLIKFGWLSIDNLDYSSKLYVTLKSEIPKLEKNLQCLFFFKDGDKLYSICAICEQQKTQKEYNNYYFMEIKIEQIKILVLQKNELYSNLHLFKMIRKNLACNLTYKRIFQINSIIK
ncbi:hypothetical protein EBU71_15165 [bacterium]|nr:hypothetical protein [Candidatus Elulimicrobium humile]